MAVAEMADRAVFVGQWLEPGSVSSPLLRLTDMSRRLVASLGRERLEEVDATFTAATCPTTVEGVIALHPAGYAAAVAGEELQLWEYAAETWSLVAVGAIYSNPENFHFDLVTADGEVYLQQWVSDAGAGNLSNGKCVVWRGEALVPLAEEQWPAKLRERAAFGGAAARWRGQWLGIMPGAPTAPGGAVPAMVLQRHDGQQMLTMAPTQQTIGQPPGAAVGDGRRGQFFFGFNGLHWGQWDGRWAEVETGLVMMGSGAGAGQRVWLIGMDYGEDTVVIGGVPAARVQRLYMLRRAAAQGVGLDEVQLWGADSTSGTHDDRPRLAEVQVTATPPARSRPKLAETRLHAAGFLGVERPRLAQTELWATDGLGDHEQRPRLAEISMGAARGATAGPRIEELMLWAIGQQYLPTGTHIRYLLEEGADGEIAHEIRVGAGLSRADLEQLRAIVRVDLEDVAVDELDSYDEIAVGPGVELATPGRTVRVGIIKPTAMAVPDVRVQTRRFEE